jgi:RNA polymerase sigma-70 factor (TIGR02960 family)
MDMTVNTTHPLDADAFSALVEPYRRELEVHCYRILGSVQDAEDVVQETLLAAWRGFDDFEGRASVRNWLYRIATNRSLNALRGARRRPQEPDCQAAPRATRATEVVWMQPYPDVLLESLPSTEPGPDARYEAREAIGLAFVTALQHVPPRQRAVLVLRDVLGFRTTEAAAMLDTTEASVNSMLQRARSAFEQRVPAPRDRAPAPRSQREHEVVARFTEAFERGDVAAVVALLTDDAWLSMPPVPLEYQGAALIGEFLSTVPAGGHLERFRLVPTRANGQPAFGFYVRDPHASVARAVGVMVLTLDEDRISAITSFHDTSMLPRFGLPRMLPVG